MFRKLQCNYLLPWLRDCCVGAAGFRGWVTPRLSQELSRCMNLKVKGRTWPRHGENFPPARRTELPDRKLLGLCWGMTYESQQEVNKVSERNILKNDPMSQLILNKSFPGKNNAAVPDSSFFSGCMLPIRKNVGHSEILNKAPSSHVTNHTCKYSY